MSLFADFAISPYCGEYPGEWQTTGNGLSREFSVCDKKYLADLKMADLPGDIRGYEVSVRQFDQNSVIAGYDEETVYSYLFGMIVPLYRETTSIFYFKSSFDSHGKPTKTCAIFDAYCNEASKRNGGMFYVPKINRGTEFLISKTFFKHGHPYWVSEWNEALVACGFRPFEK